MCGRTCPIRFSTLALSARWPSPLRTPESSTSAPARRASATTSKSASAHTARAMPARAGSLSALKMPDRSRSIRVDPSNASLVYVAVLGHAFGPNATRGVFRSKDGGQHWDKVLFVNDRTGAADLTMDAKDPTGVVRRDVDRRPAAVGPRRRLERRRRVQDGRRRRPLGQADERITEGPLGRIGVTVSGADWRVSGHWWTRRRAAFFDPMMAVRASLE